jgi:anti-sigma28 factor (negative regulator of flagellin synthesis)
MKIDNSHVVPPPDARPVRRSPARAEHNPAPSGDRAELSGTPATGASDAARSARIEELRARVQQGAYRVPAEDIAHSIVDDMLGGKTD